MDSPSSCYFDVKSICYAYTHSFCDLSGGSKAEIARRLMKAEQQTLQSVPATTAPSAEPRPARSTSVCGQVTKPPVISI